MEHETLFKCCKQLAKEQGYEEIRKDGGLHVTYIDQYGCDLQIDYKCSLALGLMRYTESLKVFLGGRECYNYDELSERAGYYCDDGVWEEVVYEVHARWIQDDYYARYNNHTIIELGKKEAERNRRVLEKYSVMCSMIVEEHGTLKTKASNHDTHVFLSSVADHKIEIELERWLAWSDHVNLWVDNRFCFAYYMLDDGDPGGIRDRKGRYQAGRWELVLQRLYEKYFPDTSH